MMYSMPFSFAGEVADLRGALRGLRRIGFRIGLAVGLLALSAAPSACGESNASPRIAPLAEAALPIGARIAWQAMVDFDDDAIVYVPDTSFRLTKFVDEEANVVCYVTDEGVGGTSIACVSLHGGSAPP